MMSYEALKSYAPLAYCLVGEHIVRENLMHDHDICVDCNPGGGGQSRGNKGQGTKSALEGVGRPAPADAGTESKEKTLRRRHEGQLSLEL